MNDPSKRIDVNLSSVNTININFKHYLTNILASQFKSGIITEAAGSQQFQSIQFNRIVCAKKEYKE